MKLLILTNIVMYFTEAPLLSSGAHLMVIASACGAHLQPHLGMGPGGSKDLPQQGPCTVMEVPNSQQIFTIHNECTLDPTSNSFG